MSVERPDDLGIGHERCGSLRRRRSGGDLVPERDSARGRARARLCEHEGEGEHERTSMGGSQRLELDMK